MNRRTVRREFVFGPRKIAADFSVFESYAFGFTCASGGIDDIAQVPAGNGGLWRIRALQLIWRVGAVDGQDGNRRGDSCEPAQPLVRQQYGYIGIGDREGYTLGRISRI